MKNFMITAYGGLTSAIPKAWKKLLNNQAEISSQSKYDKLYIKQPPKLVGNSIIMMAKIYIYA